VFEEGCDLVPAGYGHLTTACGEEIQWPVLDFDEPGFSHLVVTAKRGENPAASLPGGALEGDLGNAADLLLKGDALEDLWFVLTYTPYTPATASPEGEN
jgi:hypothetical protein